MPRLSQDDARIVLDLLQAAVQSSCGDQLLRLRLVRLQRRLAQRLGQAEATTPAGPAVRPTRLPRSQPACPVPPRGRSPAEAGPAGTSAGVRRASSPPTAGPH